MNNIKTLLKLEKLENKFEEVSLKTEAIENKIYEYEEKEKCVFSLEEKKMQLETKQYEIQEKIEEIEKNVEYVATGETTKIEKDIKESTSYFQHTTTINKVKILHNSVNAIYTINYNGLARTYKLTIHNLDTFKSTIYNIDRKYATTVIKEITELQLQYIK